MATWITTPAELDAYFQQRPTRIGLDTEFIRERTFWPQLALVQMAVGQDILLIDPLIPGMTEALAPWLADESITKVMHSASEDLVAFKWACGVLPRPLFDTQIGASLAGIGGGMGYQKLVAEITGVALAKGETRSDWMRRPLSESQLQYAADDVEHLFALHDAINARLQALGRQQWLHDDGERLLASVANDEDRWPHLAMRSAQFLMLPPSTACCACCAGATCRHATATAREAGSWTTNWPPPSRARHRPTRLRWASCSNSSRRHRASWPALSGRRCPRRWPMKPTRRWRCRPTTATSRP